MSQVISKRKLGNGPEITEVGLGTWAIGGDWRFGWGQQDPGVSEKTILKSLEKGINWIDTAPAYGLGLAEEILGKVLGSKRKEIFISTKCGIVWNESRRVSFSMDPKSIRKECEDSLKRLQTSYIDFFQIHWPDTKTLVEDAWSEMSRLKKEGKVRYIGLSNFDLKRVKRCEKIEHVDFLQMPYNMLRRDIEEEILPYCLKNNSGLLAYSPMQSGLLTGKFTRGYVENLQEGDWRKKDSFFKGELFGKIIQFVEFLKPMAQKYGKELSAMAVSWVLARNEVSSAIVGARTQEQAEKISSGSQWKINEEDLKKIKEYLDQLNL